MVLWRELFNIRMAVMVEQNLYGHFKYVIYMQNFPQYYAHETKNCGVCVFLKGSMKNNNTNHHNKLATCICCWATCLHTL